MWFLHQKTDINECQGVNPCANDRKPHCVNEAGGYHCAEETCSITPGLFNRYKSSQCCKDQRGKWRVHLALSINFQTATTITQTIVFVFFSLCKTDVSLFLKSIGIKFQLPSKTGGMIPAQETFKHYTSRERKGVMQP